MAPDSLRFELVIGGERGGEAGGDEVEENASEVGDCVEALGLFTAWASLTLTSGVGSVDSVIVSCVRVVLPVDLSRCQRSGKQFGRSYTDVALSLTD